MIQNISKCEVEATPCGNFFNFTTIQILREIKRSVSETQNSPLSIGFTENMSDLMRVSGSELIPEHYSRRGPTILYRQNLKQLSHFILKNATLWKSKQSKCLVTLR